MMGRLLSFALCTSYWVWLLSPCVSIYSAMDTFHYGLYSKAHQKRRQKCTTALGCTMKRPPDITSLGRLPWTTFLWSPNNHLRGFLPTPMESSLQTQLPLPSTNCQIPFLGHQQILLLQLHQQDHVLLLLHQVLVQRLLRSILKLQSTVYLG